MGFQGFPKATTDFLAQLTENNNKAWFDAHRTDYDNFYIAPAQAFVVALGDKLKQIEPGITADPRVNKTIFRINRDIRFSKDKTPYKNHIDLWFYQNEKRQPGRSGFFFRLLSHQVVVGAGVHGFDKTGLQRFRQAVDAQASGEALDKMLATLKRDGYIVGEPHYKKVPRDFETDHPRAELLRFNALAVRIETPLPKENRTAAFVDWCFSHCKKVHPVHRWLVEHVHA